MLLPNHFLRPLEAVGTGGAQKCRGSGAPNPNRHPNQTLCHAMWVAACVFDVVAKARTMATNFLMFCSTSSDGEAFVVGASGVLCWDCDAGEGSM